MTTYKQIERDDVRVGDEITDPALGEVFHMYFPCVYGPVVNGWYQWVIRQDFIRSARRLVAGPTLIGPDGWEPKNGDYGWHNRYFLVEYRGGGWFLSPEDASNTPLSEGTIRALVVNGEPWTPPLSLEADAVLRRAFRIAELWREGLAEVRPDLDALVREVDDTPYPWDD